MSFSLRPEYMSGVSASPGAAWGQQNASRSLNTQSGLVGLTNLLDVKGVFERTATVARTRQHPGGSSSLSEHALIILEEPHVVLNSRNGTLDRAVHF